MCIMPGGRTVTIRSDVNLVQRFGQTIFPNDVFTNEYILLPQFLAAKISVYAGSDVTGQPKETRYIRDVQLPSTFNRQVGCRLCVIRFQRHRALAESTPAHAHEKSATLSHQILSTLQCVQHRPAPHAAYSTEPRAHHQANDPTPSTKLRSPRVTPDSWSNFCRIHSCPRKKARKRMVPHPQLMDDIHGYDVLWSVWSFTFSPNSHPKQWVPRRVPHAFWDPVGLVPSSEYVASLLEQCVVFTPPFFDCIKLAEIHGFESAGDEREPRHSKGDHKTVGRPTKTEAAERQNPWQSEVISGDITLRMTDFSLVPAN
ncbi:hypothetical protein C8R44DRAFT_736589 [Mycena epipterygia]|nr:hypothetical protein C8R44DRAFT_736589 [Mycena epipterygia]